MFCHECGSPISGSAMFCGKCGANLNKTRITQASETPSSVPMDEVAEKIRMSQYAGRGSRFAAAIIDLSIAVIVCLMSTIFVSIASKSQGGMTSGVIAIGVGWFGILIAAQTVLLVKYGQSLGKRALGIRIVTNSDERVPGFIKVWLLRMWVPSLIAGIPYIGIVVWLVDNLFIFRDDRRCLHDLIAETKVIKSHKRFNHEWAIWVAVSLPVISLFATFITYNKLDSKNGPETGIIHEVWEAKSRFIHGGKDTLDPKIEKEMDAALKQRADEWFAKGQDLLRFDGTNIDRSQNDAALNAFNESIGLNPNNNPAYFFRGIAYSNRGDYVLAIKDLDKAIESNPTHFTAFFYRGLTYSKLGNYATAIKNFDKAIELVPQFPSAYFSRGNAHWMLGNRETAVADLKIAARDGHLKAQTFLKKNKIDW